MPLMASLAAGVVLFSSARPSSGSIHPEVVALTAEFSRLERGMRGTNWRMPLVSASNAGKRTLSADLILELLDHGFGISPTFKPPRGWRSSSAVFVWFQDVETSGATCSMLIHLAWGPREGYGAIVKLRKLGSTWSIVYRKVKFVH